MSDELSWTDYEKYLMALCLWREARSEPIEGQEAVCWTIRNRMRVGWFNPTGSLSGAILHPMQYSSLTDPNDRQLTKFPVAVKHPDGTVSPDVSFSQCLWVVSEVMRYPDYADPTGGADSYFDDSIQAPTWAREECARGKIGRLSFFRVLS